MTAVNWSEIAGALGTALGKNIQLQSPGSIGGGCINETWRASDQYHKHWFIKLNKPPRKAMFEAEMAGLKEILETGSIHAPKPVCVGQNSRHSFLVMEFMELRGGPSPTLTGARLAAMHHHIKPEFGWHINNTIGSTPQHNGWRQDWAQFWQQQRLGFQLNLALQRGISRSTYDAGRELCECISFFFVDYQPVASLLHGDLWAGNCSTDDQGNPVIYDPAVYYGDREADLAMTELFGGFGSHFMESYHEHFPIDPGFSTRKTLYNLYHILNHYNLFGGSYGLQADSMIQRLLSAVR